MVCTNASGLGRFWSIGNAISGPADTIIIAHQLFSQQIMMGVVKSSHFNMLWTAKRQPSKGRP